MKALTILIDRKHPISEEDIQYFEQKFSIQLPAYLRSFMIKYGGCRTKERFYHQGETLHQLSQLLYVREQEGYASMEAVYEGLQGDDIEGYVPFAIDPGGWDYSISVRPETYGQVWLDKFDSGAGDTMFFVCNSFEAFIEGLSDQE